MHLRLDVTESHRHPLIGVGFNGQTPADLTETTLRVALLGERSQLARQHTHFMAEMPDPLQPLRDARVSDEILRPLAEVMIIDELLGSGRAARVTQFRLGASVGGLRRLELSWEAPREYENENRRKRHLVGQVRL